MLSEVSLHIAPGEAYGLVGESGCGKTTVAMAVMRYLAPNARVDAGRILFGGIDLLAASDRTRASCAGTAWRWSIRIPGARSILRFLSASRSPKCFATTAR